MFGTATKDNFNVESDDSLDSSDTELQRDMELKRAFDEIKKLKKQLQMSGITSLIGWHSSLSQISNHVWSRVGDMGCRQ